MDKWRYYYLHFNNSLMKKIISILSFLFLAVHCFSQDFPIPQNLGNKNTKVIDSGGLVTKVFIPINFPDTTNANIANYIKFNPGGIIRTNQQQLWLRDSTASKWIPITTGSATATNIYNSDGYLTGNRVVDIGTKSLKFTSASSTTNPAGQMLWAQKIDTFTNGAGFIEGLSIYGNKRNLFPNSIQSNYMGGYLFNSNYEAKDSVYIYSVGGDFGWNLNSNMTLTKYPAFTGRTVIQGGTVDFDAVPNMFSQITTSGSTSSVNNVHAKGWWANNTSFVNLSNVNDTLDNFISYFSGGLTTGKLRKHYIVYGKDLGNTDSSWGAFFPSTTTRNVLGGSTSIGSSTNSGPTHTLEVFGNQTIKGNDSVGSRLSANWTLGSLPAGISDNTPGTSLTFTGAGMAVSGGGLDLNNSLDWGFSIGVPYWKVHQQVIVGSKNNTSFGFGVELNPTAGNGQSYFAHFLLSDTAGYIAFTGSNSMPVFGSPNNKNNLTFKWSVGDTLDCYIERQDRTAVITMRNLTNGMVSQLTYSVIFTGTSILKLHFYGGSFTFIGSLDLSYNAVKIPAKILLGTSLSWGANATVQDSTFFSLGTSRIQGACYNFGHPSEQANNGYFNLEDILTYLQSNSNTVVEVEYGVNEHNNAVPLDTFGARLRRVCTPLVAAGCKVILINCVPQLTSVVSTNDTINSVANSFTPHLRVADVYTALVGTGTSINPIYAYGDNVHINNNGSVQAAGAIWEQEKDLLTVGSPLNVSPMPTISNPQFYLAIDDQGNFGRTYPGTSNAWIKNAPTVDGTTIQTANFNISGKGAVGLAFEVPGFGNLSSPSFGVNIDQDGYTKAALFLSKNFATSTAGYSYIDGSLTSDPRLIFFSGAYIGAHQQPLLIKPDDATTGAIGLRVTNGTNSAVPSTYKIATFEQNLGSGDVVKAYFDRSGGLHTDSVSGYNYNNSSLYTAQSWTSKKYVDSVTALATAINNANVGGGYRVLMPASQNIKTLFAGTNITLDSTTNANGITIFASGGGTGTDNANLGAGFRWVVPASQGIKTIFNNVTTGISWDSASNTNGITPTIDTLLLATRAWRQKGIDSVASLITGATGWAIVGNAGTTAGTNYLGSSDNVAIDFRTNATQAMRLNTAQELMIGSTTDAGAYKLQVTGDTYTTGAANLDAASNQLQFRVSGTLTYQVSSANVGGTSNPDLYINDNNGPHTPFVLISGTGNLGLYGATAFTSPTSGVQLFTSLAYAYVAKTANYTATIADGIIEATSGTFQITLPTAVGIVGRVYNLVNSGAGTLTIGTTSSQVFLNVAGTPTTITLATVGTTTVASNGTGWLVL